jgi:hypothetical protein
VRHAVKHGRLVLAVVVSAVIAAVVMPIALSQGAQTSQVKLSKAQQRKRQAMRGRRGPQGPRGFRGLTGPTGPAGATGPAGPSVQVHGATVNWQNNQWQGRSTAGFPIPGIGFGQIVCDPKSQQLQIYPFNSSHYITVWYVREQTSSGGVYGPTLATDRFTPDHNQQFMNEGFNKFSGPESTSTGSFHGIISDRGPGGVSGPGPAPTSFHVSFDWNFTDTNTYRCFVAASFTTGA